MNDCQTCLQVLQNPAYRPARHLFFVVLFVLVAKSSPRLVGERFFLEQRFYPDPGTSEGTPDQVWREQISVKNYPIQGTNCT